MDNKGIGCGTKLLVLLAILAILNSFGSKTSTKSYSNSSYDPYDRYYSEEEIHEFVNSYDDNW